MKQFKEGKKIMRRSASDNKYLHKDFHQSMNLLMNYIYNNFGEAQLILYLKQYSEAYYKEIKPELKTGNIDILLKYFEDIYKKEEWPVKIKSTQDFIEIEQDACPGITHIKSMGEEPCPCYKETYQTVYKTLCDDTPFEYILEFFDNKTGACKQIFKRKEAVK